MIHQGEYPADWPAIALAIKDEAGWRCVRCQRDHAPRAGYCLTVHHLNGNKSDCRWWNCPALCQRCHLHIQAKVDPARPWIFDHSTWFLPYAAGLYAWRYLGLELSREETMARLGELLALEAQTLLGSPPIALAVRL